MSVAKHAPGPWLVRDMPTAQRYIGPVGDGGAPSVALVMARVNVPDERLAADARLIAAAPELLESLQRAADTMHDTSMYFMMLGKSEGAAAYATAAADARAAIAKATGGAQ